MKRFLRISIVPVIAGLVMIVGLVFSTGTAAAATTSSLSIAPQGQFIDLFQVDVEVAVKCFGGTGTVSVKVTQTAAQSSNGIGNTATAATVVKCDGNEHDLALFASGFGGQFTLGPADAQASLTLAPSGPAFAERTITLVSP